MTAVLRLLHVVTVLTICVHGSWAYNSYLLVFPKTIRPSMEFNATLTLLKNFPQMEVKIAIVSGKQTIVEKQVPISKGADGETIKLDLPEDLVNAQYQLEVTAVDNDNEQQFQNTSDLVYSSKKMSVFIQSDKAIYKPGQIVQIKAFGVDPELKPVFGLMDVDIFDPKNNKIAHWPDQAASDETLGIVSISLQLSAQPPLGDWKIVVDFQGSKTTSIITVAEFVLPKFEVTLTTKSFGLVSDEYLSGTIAAKYTFNNGVKGSGTLVVKRKYSSDRDRAFQLEFEIHGDYTFNINRKDLATAFGLKALNTETLEIFAEVAEGLTGNKMNDKTQLRFYTKEEKLVFMDGPENFKPGLKYTAYLFLSDQQDKPLSTNNAQVSVTVTMFYPDEEIITQTKPLDIDEQNEPIAVEATDEPIPIIGKMSPFIFPPPIEENTHNMTLGPEVINVPKNGIVVYSFVVPLFINTITIQSNYEYENENKKLTTTKQLERFRSTSKTYVQVLAPSKTPKVGKRTIFKVRSTMPSKKVNYLIMSKGMVVKDGKFKLKKNKKLRFRVTSAMAPTARIVVYWTRQDGEIIADAVEFNVEGIFDNEVDLDFSRKESEPGKNVSITVTADPQSECGVLVVDKSVLLLKTGNQLTPTKVEDELREYDPVAPSPCGFGPCFRWWFPIPTGGVDVTAIFENSGLGVVTDAFLYQWQRPFNLNYTAWPVAMAGAGGVFKDGQPELASSSSRVRTHFPDTWMYQNVKTSSKGKAVIESTVPDTITSWVATAFAISNKTGLGVLPEPINFKVFLDFFIRLDLPYSVVRGEQVVLQANIFNFYKKTLKVKVTLKESSSFKNIIVERKPNNETKLLFRNQEIVRDIQVPPGGGVAVNLPIQPEELGNIDIEIVATTRRAGDAVRKQLLVKAEGIADGYNVIILLDLRDTNLIEEIRGIRFPPDVVEGSECITISAIGDLMGPSISGLSNLLKMPYGCGEQNMITFVPNIFVMKYLTAIGNLKTEDENRAKGFMLTGYQTEMTYQHYNGSFSAFGNNDPSGSTWLTAFVVKSFAMANSYIYIDPVVMTRAIDWIINQYNCITGTFNEPGRVIHTDMQGGSASGENLASYIIIALTEARDNGFVSTEAADLQATLEGSTQALEDAVDTMDEVFEMAIASYPLALVGSNKQNQILDMLDAEATEKDGMKYWEIDPEVDTSELIWVPPYHQSKSRNIEATAYVLLTYAAKEDTVNGLKVMKWLVQQRKPSGGFGSTQDTVIALQALANFAALIHSKNFGMDITISGTPGTFEHIFNINPVNALVLQTVKAPTDIQIVNVKAEGSGVAMLEIVVRYNIMEDIVQPLFELNISFSDETLNGFKLRACFSWLGEDTSGMAVMEVGLLSGFAAEKFSVTDLNILKRKEDNQRQLVLYFDEITSDRECIDIRMQRTDLVGGSQPALMKLYDYYEPKNHAFSLYQPKLLKDATVCDIDRKALGC